MYEFWRTRNAVHAIFEDLNTILAIHFFSHSLIYKLQSS